MKMPVHRGPHRFTKINSKEEFDRIVLARDQDGKKIQNSKNSKNPKNGTQIPYKELDMAIVEFWAPFANTCLYVPIKTDSRRVQFGQNGQENLLQKI